MEAVDKVNILIKDFLSPLGDINVVCSSDFYYDFEKNELGWSFLANERQDETFTEFFEKVLNCQTCNTFIYSLFHEVGHKMTYESFSGMEWLLYRLKVDDLDEVEDARERDFMYYNLPIERAASEWAVEYISNHIYEIKEWFDNTLAAAFNKIFEDEELAMYISELVD